MRGKAKNGVTHQGSSTSVPPPHISNKESIWKLTGREKAPPKKGELKGS